MIIAHAVEVLDASDADAIVDVLTEAFTGYPVMRHVLGDGDPDRLRDLVRLFAMARVLRNEPLLGIRIGDTLAAAAIVSDPHGPPAPATFFELRTRLWDRLGADAEARYDRYGQATRGFAIAAPHLHLNMIGVRTAWRRQGLARRLIDAVQDLSRRRPGSTGVSLTTEDPANVPFYQKLGFDIIGSADMAPGIRTWGFFRPDATSTLA